LLILFSQHKFSNKSIIPNIFCFHRRSECLLTLGLDRGIEFDSLDNTNGNSLSHISDSESSQRWVFSESLNAHWLGWLKLDDAGITGLDEFRVFLKNLTGSSVHLLLDVRELTGDVGGVAIQNWRVTVTDLSRVVHDNDLSFEGLGWLGRLSLGVRGNVSSSKILDGDVLDVESNVVTRDGFWEGLVVHLDGFDLSLDHGWGDKSSDTRLQDTGLNSSYRNSSDTTNLVNILKWKSQWFVSGSLWRGDVVKGLKKTWSLVPLDVLTLVDHVITDPSGDRNEWNLHWLVTNLLEVGGDLSLDLIVSGFVVVDGLIVHLVTGDDHLLDTKGVGKKSVLSGLTIFGDTSLETTLGGVDNKNGDIGLGGTGDHVLDEISVSRSINDGERILWGLEFPEGDIDGDTSFSFGLEVIKNPGIFERRFTELGSFLLEFLDGSLINTTTFVDQVTSGGGFTGIDVTDDD
jgi:hypothetical protein